MMMMTVKTVSSTEVNEDALGISNKGKRRKTDAANSDLTNESADDENCRREQGDQGLCTIVKAE